MDKTDTQIRDLREAMRAEKDVRVYKRMMAVRVVLAGHSTKDAACFADVCRRAVQEWTERFHRYASTASGISPEGAGSPAQSAGGSKSSQRIPRG